MVKCFQPKYWLLTGLIAIAGCEREAAPPPPPQPSIEMPAAPTEQPAAASPVEPPAPASPLPPSPDGYAAEIPDDQRRELELAARKSQAQEKLTDATQAANRKFEQEMKNCMQVPSDQAEDCRTGAQTNHEAALAAARADHDAAILDAAAAW